MVGLYTVIINRYWIPAVLGIKSVLRRVTFKCMEIFILMKHGQSGKLHFNQMGLLIKNEVYYHTLSRIRSLIYSSYWLHSILESRGELNRSFYYSLFSFLYFNSS